MSSYVLLANLRAGRCSSTAEVRLLRFWEARNVRKDGELMSLDMLLLDEQSTLIHGSINSSRVDTFRRRLNIVGEVSSVRSTITDGLRGPQRVMVTLRLEGDVNVCVSMFDDRAVTFQTKFDEHISEPKVILLTSINPKVVGGKLFLNATSGTHFYFDCETSAGKEHYERLVGDGANASSSKSKVVSAQKIEPLTVAELNQYVLAADPHNIEFLCKAEVTSLQSEKGWCYIGCSKCAKKLQRDETSFTCLSCDRENATGVLRYRVAFSVADHTDAVVFVAFDTEIAKLTNIQASEAAHILGAGVNARVDSDFPPFLNEVVGKTFTFQLKLGEFNFASKHQSFTVSRIISEHERAPLPATILTPLQWFQGGDHGPDDNGDGAVGVAPKIDESTVVSNNASASNVPYHGSQAANKQKLVNDGNVKKKARKE
ncbi:unnamed protein product [Brassica oleracea var. botrytis]|uniref:Replication factor A C-terminal domain-containing protein n=2 Tax=Brassica TaxID=3705 RepID=A0A3P6AZD7_BRAOL|nr:unnamed protein product [Brassica napus]CDY20355.1 BnaC02g24610D [Brassica napus]VDC96407.1 unnamed protein product [Brassica oleracea]